MKIGIFGSSYVTRLNSWCRGYFKVPAIVRFFGKGGMRADRIPSVIFSELLSFRPDVVFLQLGGNDISDNCVPNEILKNITNCVNELRNSGVQRVFVGEILQRGDFRKAPGLDIIRFDRIRKVINKKLQKLFKDEFIVFPKLKYPRDYLDDKVHLNDKGLTTYHLKLRRLFSSVKL